MQDLLKVLDYSMVNFLEVTAKHYNGSVYPIGELLFCERNETFYVSVGASPDVTRVIDGNGVECTFHNQDLVIVDRYGLEM
jgi:hypothetical protein